MEVLGSKDFCYCGADRVKSSVEEVMRKRFSTTRLGVVIACLLSSALVPASAAQADVFNVKAYGAVGDGVQDDTAEFNAAIAAVPAIGGEVYVPAGTYKLSSALTITDKSISFRGEGQRISKLLWTSPSSGLVFSSTGADNKTLKRREVVVVPEGNIQPQGRRSPARGARLPTRISLRASLRPL